MMDPHAIVNAFSKPGEEEMAREYLAAHGVLQAVEKAAVEAENSIAPDVCDLARLHAVVRARRAFTVLEFGVGYSTLVMAHALEDNRAEWEALHSGGRPAGRLSSAFELHVVDSSVEWMEVAKARLSSSLKQHVKFHHSSVTAGTFRDLACHYYDSLPEVVPDFIYLDGPDPKDVRGVPGVGDWSVADRPVMAADLLRLEPLLLPGACVLVDGRVANARFVRSHFYRRWEVLEAVSGAVTAFELQEPPLGSRNSAVLRYCLGERAAEWL